MPSIRETIWKLRTDPFYPEIDNNGKPIAPAAWDKSLNPLIDDRVVAFYFDVYDWTASDLVGGLSTQQALARFPTPRTLPGTGLLVLISGSRETGLDSLANLVLHKIRLTGGGQPPLVVDVELEGRDKARNVAAVARRIITRVEFGQPQIPDGEKIARRMEAQYDRVSKEQDGRKDATYSELFQSFRDLLEPVGRTLVIKITKGGDHDSWVRIHESARSCCLYVIVMTPDYPYAKTCYDAMVGSSLNVAWIQAKPLDQAKAREYVEHRLAAERDATPKQSPLESLFPFTPDAIAALYEPGAAGASGKPLDYPIGWLRRTLFTALRDHLGAMDQKYGNANSQALAAIDPATTSLGRAQLIGARIKLNRGD